MWQLKSIIVVNSGLQRNRTNHCLGKEGPCQYICFHPSPFFHLSSLCFGSTHDCVRWWTYYRGNRRTYHDLARGAVTIIRTEVNTNWTLYLLDYCFSQIQLYFFVYFCPNRTHFCACSISVRTVTPAVFVSWFGVTVGAYDCRTSAKTLISTG